MERIYRKYIDRNYKDQSLDMITEAKSIMDEYMNQDLTITLRQLYYQFVARDMLPESWKDKKTGSTNNERSYKKLGTIITNARMTGHLAWSGMEDRTRPSHGHNSWETPADIMATTVKAFATPKWDDMLIHPEIWVEKEALSGIIEIPADQYQVPWMAAKGYMSKDAMWKASQRIIKRFEKNGQDTVIIYLGDHDPSGLDMIRDIRDQLEVFMDGCEALPRVEPIALTMQQIRDHNPPPNPTKTTDSRANKYMKRYGKESWELDALNPSYLVNLIRDSIKMYMPDDAWLEKIAKDNKGKAFLEKAAMDLKENWSNSIGNNF